MDHVEQTATYDYSLVSPLRWAHQGCLQRR